MSTCLKQSIVDRMRVMTPTMLNRSDRRKAIHASSYSLRYKEPISGVRLKAIAVSSFSSAAS